MLLEQLKQLDLPCVLRVFHDDEHVSNMEIFSINENEWTFMGKETWLAQVEIRFHPKNDAEPRKHYLADLGFIPYQGDLGPVWNKHNRCELPYPITVKQIIQATREEIAARPDVIYHGHCNYLSGTCSDGSIGCVFGQVFKKLGIEIDNKCSNFSIGELFYTLKIPATNVQKSWLSEIQCRQDHRQSWSEALKTADDMYPLYTIPTRS